MSRRWPAITLALAVAASITFRPGISNAKGCTSLSAVVGKITADNTLVEMRVLQGKKLALAVEAFNAGEEIEIPWGAAYLAVRRDGWLLLLVGFDSQICFAMKLNPDQARLFLKSLDGQSI